MRLLDSGQTLNCWLGTRSQGTMSKDARGRWKLVRRGMGFSMRASRKLSCYSYVRQLIQK